MGTRPGSRLAPNRVLSTSISVTRHAWNFGTLPWIVPIRVMSCNLRRPCPLRQGTRHFYYFSLRTLTFVYSFHDLAWTPAQDGHSRGIIAGAFDNGSLGLWDAEKAMSNAAEASIFNNKVHTGAIKALQFNPKIQNFLATGGAKGELFISDLNHLDAPIRLGSTAARADDIDCLDWNKKVSNILVTGSSGGFVTVWDMKTRKESLTLNNLQRKPASAIAWDPDKPTRLITAVPLEQEPVILVWDLRNSNAPEKVLRGHDSGVLSVSWCPQDNDLLLSCGKDNRTILWNPSNRTGVRRLSGGHELDVSDEMESS